MLHGSEYFSTKEFACKCGCGFGAQEYHIASDLIHALHCLRVKINLPFVVTSGARCLKHNTASEGGARSTHMAGGVGGECTKKYEGQCRAVDVSTSGWSMAHRAEAIQMALAMGLRVGMATTFLHFDVENAPFYGEGIWNYGAKENSTGGN